MICFDWCKCVKHEPEKSGAAINLICQRKTIDQHNRDSVFMEKIHNYIEYMYLLFQ